MGTANARPIIAKNMEVAQDAREDFSQVPVQQPRSPSFLSSSLSSFSKIMPMMWIHRLASVYKPSDRAFCIIFCALLGHPQLLEAVPPSNSGTAAPSNSAKTTSAAAQKPSSPPTHSQKFTKEIESALSSFTLWVQKYSKAQGIEKEKLIPSGIEAARKRREALLTLFDSSPDRAMSQAVPWKTRVQLPEEVVKLLETPVAGCGEFNVLAARKIDAKTGALRVEIMRYSAINGQVFKTRVYGRRRGVTTKYNISQHGIAFDNILLVHESPIRIVADGEAIPAAAQWSSSGRKCPLCGNETNSTVAITVQIGNTYYVFDSEAHLKQIEAELERLENIVSPTKGSVCAEPLAKVIESMKQGDDDGGQPPDRRDHPFGDEPIK